MKKKMSNYLRLGKMIIALGHIKTGLVWINGDSNKEQIDRGISLVRGGTRSYLYHKSNLR